MQEISELLHFESESGTWREATLDGKEYLVCDSVIVKESVMNFTLMPANVVGRRYDAWSGEALIADHPPRMENGQPQTANQTQFYESKIIGTTFNASTDIVQNDSGADRTRLKAEAWLDIEKAERLDFGWIVADIKAGKSFPVSVGCWVDSVQQSGEFDGKAYVKVATNLTPDHVAIITAGDGACSLESGDCGISYNEETESEMCEIGSGDCCDACRLNNENETEFEMKSDQQKSLFGFLANLGRKSGMPEETVAAFEESLAENMMASDVYKQLQQQADEQFGSWAMSVIDFDADTGKAYFVEWVSGKTYECEYSLNNSTITMGENKTEVVRQTSYAPKDSDGAAEMVAETSNKETSAMTDSKTATPEITENSDTVAITQAEHAEFLALRENENKALAEMRAQIVTHNPALEALVENADRAALEAVLAGFKESKESKGDDDEEMGKDKKNMKENEAEETPHNFSGSNSPAPVATSTTEAPMDTFEAIGQSK